MPRESGASSNPRRRGSTSDSTITGISAGACHRARRRRVPVADDDAQCAWKSIRSLRRGVFSVLHGEDDARAIVEAVAVLFGEVIDALARGDFTFGQEGLTNSLAEFRRARLSAF